MTTLGGGRLAVALLLLLASVDAFAEPELVDRIVAIVDRDIVMLSEAEQAMWLVEMRTGDETELARVVEQLVEARLIEREVARFSDEPVPDALVDEQLERLRSSFGSKRAFDDMLAERGSSEDEMRSEVRRQLTVNRYLEQRFRALTYVTDDDIATYFAEEILSKLPSGMDEREPTPAEIEQIRRILEERKFNERVEQWIQGLKDRSRIRRYVW